MPAINDNRIYREVSVSGGILKQGELLVGAATVRLSDVSIPCSRIIFSAPTVNHTVGEANTSNILIGGNSSSNAGGGVLLANDNFSLPLPFDNANFVYLTGFSAGDVVEYMIIG